jgi:hypothetical protein
MVKDMKYHLNVLANGLIVCDIKILNPFSLDCEVECAALIDTGAEGSIICLSLFHCFEKIDRSRKIESGISTLNGESKMFKYPFSILLPSVNSKENINPIAVHDLSHREEYKAIIGMDLLRRFEFGYSGRKKTAWLKT